MHKVLVSLLLASSLLLGGIGASSAAEPVRKQEDLQPFFERYTNAAQDVILQALKLVGVRYRWGGNDEDSGLDCSGFVRLAFKDSIGTSLPRTAREMSQVGQQVEASQLKPGDLVFFNTMRRTFSHVGIYLGDNHFLHAPRKGAEVRIESMESNYWMSRYNGARRILESD
ncbi:MAG: glycoside hydrolase [Betaproteobacteria bacterium HGW-Betaproteobacteria-4]|jgi:cell wall-associated NlpC family hydrolase|nr:MAG: glycoside hydrolase [Betaproteobacteria bacterium HGW-Betaproteobacteria-4]